MDVVNILLRAVIVVAVIVALIRLNGLRSFSKMSGFDFAITIAVGSVLASAAMSSDWPGFWRSTGALVALFLVQGAISRVRAHFGPFQQVIDNSPLMLMRDGEILEENLSRGNISRDDLMGKLREANALRLKDVRAVILENTGDVSVLHGQGDVDDALLDGVRR
ncbi:DUF421 domain-containing protein [Palleronia sp. LCG004]|uniref:DUF421 domain-containing protein n=1 Tax=Palleronia sp. LCG004 TaxID=3079304 RepID=UPI002942987C|nr:YetF domain-containing protein [Palleronia sp. LCG004]WOI56102.1 DUF421 domain-containing protein [Palleronia sp. LCG004]